MSKEDDILNMHEEIRDRFGQLDVCVNNAITSINSSMIFGKTEDWRYMLEVHTIIDSIIRLKLFCVTNFRITNLYDEL